MSGSAGQSGVEDDPAALLEGDCDAQVAADLDVFIARLGGEEVARGERADGLAGRLLGGLLLEELEQASHRKDLCHGVVAERHRTGADEIDNRRDQLRGGVGLRGPGRAVHRCSSWGWSASIRAA